MKFSFFMMPVHHPSENPALAFQRDISFIHLADELGFDEFFIGEHHSGGWETMPAPEMALSMAAVAAKYRRWCRVRGCTGWYLTRRVTGWPFGFCSNDACAKSFDKMVEEAEKAELSIDHSN